MKLLFFPAAKRTAHLLSASVAVLLWAAPSSLQADADPVSKWEVFETEFRSSRSYENPPQETTLTVSFVSPSGRTNRVHGFWNGGSKWAVRFRPDELGRWSYATECSDIWNTGLRQQSGSFLCMVQSLRTTLQQHGPLTVTPGTSTFRHADGTPFFWLADGVWQGARQSTSKEWAQYAQTRTLQGFNGALWRAAPGADERNRAAFAGTTRIELDLGFLKSLDEKIITLNQSDLVSGIAPLWEIGLPEEDLLPEDQIIVLLRQMVARWDAYHVAWVIAFEADTAGRHAARWRRIGRNVFDQVQHSPVILYCGSTHWALKEFSRESWVNGLAFQSGDDASEDAVMWLARGPASGLWKEEPRRPVLNLLPATEGGFDSEARPIGSAQAIQALARSLFVAPPAGLCYQSRPVALWDPGVDTNTLATTGVAMTEWQKGLFLPGARRAGQIRNWLEESQVQRLVPSGSVLLPGDSTGLLPMSALVAPNRERALLYLPQDRTARINRTALQGNPTASGFSLQTGQTQPVEARVEARVENGITHFTAPGPGDWLLLLTTSPQ